MELNYISHLITPIKIYERHFRFFCLLLGWMWFCFFPSNLVMQVFLVVTTLMPTS